jgi:hypothetical protein
MAISTDTEGWTVHAVQTTVALEKSCRQLPLVSLDVKQPPSDTLPLEFRLPLTFVNTSVPPPKFPLTHSPMPSMALVKPPPLDYCPSWTIVNVTQPPPNSPTAHLDMIKKTFALPRHDSLPTRWHSDYHKVERGSTCYSTDCARAEPRAHYYSNKVTSLEHRGDVAWHCIRFSNGDELTVWPRSAEKARRNPTISLIY